MAQTVTRIESPADLWQGYDPESLPLDKTSIKTGTEGEGAYESLRFTSEIIDGVPVRVFAMIGAPATGNGRAGILHIHGGGQTASLDWVRFWVKRGYVCVTFDFCGPWDNRKDVTDWGPLKHGNMKDAAGGLQVHPTPRESSWYHWTIASRRALTLLAGHPQVDPGRLGIYGISMGGTLTWMVSGCDRRVKAAAPIYGCGYNYDRRNVEWGHPPISDNLNTFQRVVSAEAHAPYVTCPVLFFDATNDFHGLMDRAYDTLNVVRAPVRQIFTARVNHHIAPEDGRNLPLWMDWHLNGGKPFPASPTVTIKLDAEGIPAGFVQVADADEIDNVEIFYSLGNRRPNARFWRRSVAERSGTTWLASLPVMDAWDDVRAFANVSYRSGVRLSSNLAHVVPAKLGKARSTLQTQSEMAHGQDGLDHWYFTASYTDPMLDWGYLKKGNDPDIGPTISLQPERSGDPTDLRLSTHIIGDPQWKGRDGQLFSIMARGDFPADGLKLILIEDDWGPRSRRYTAAVTKLEQPGNWNELKLPMTEFKDAEGHSPSSWKSIDKLEIEAKSPRRNPPQFARLRWVSPD